MNLFNFAERYRFRDVLPFTRSFAQDYECSVWLYWMIGACVAMVALMCLAFVIDRVLKARGLR